MTGGDRTQSDAAILDGLGRGLATLAGLGVLLAFAPGVIAGVLIACGLRFARCRWTWAVLVAIPLAIPAAVEPMRRVREVQAVATAAIDGQGVDVARVCGAVWPIWASVAGLTAVIAKRWMERRTRLHGGRGERELKRELGIVAVARRALERRRAHRAPLGDARGVLLGFSRTGEPLRIPPLRTHAMIVGGSGSGKTTSAQVLLEGEVEAGRGFLVLDGKGGRGLPEFAVELGARYHRPVALWSVLPYGATALDDLRRAWNPAGGGNPTEIKDRIAAAEEQTEPYYAAIAARGLLCAARAAQQEYGRAPGLDELASLLDSPAQLVSLLRSVDPTGHARDIAWLGGLTDGERSGLRGMGTRLVTMVNSDGGEWLLPQADNEIDLYRAVTEGWLVVFTLPEGTYPALIPHVCRYALAALNAVGTRLEREGRLASSVVFVDELSAFDGDQLCGGLERGRSAGMSYIVATQSVSNFRTAGGEKLLDAVLDNSELVLIHRQTAPEAAEHLAQVAGTAEAWEHTHLVSDRYSRRLLGDESGERTRRLTEQFRAHPNDIKQLAIGEAILVRNRPRFAVEHIRIRSATSPKHAN